MPFIGASSLKDPVLAVQRSNLGVGFVRFFGEDLVVPGLFEEELANMVHAPSIGDEGTVVTGSPVSMDHGVDVSGAALVKAGVQGGDFDDTIIVGEVTATEEALLVYGVGGTEHAAVATIEASGVAVPELDECVGDGLASLNIEDTNVEDKRYATGCVAIGRYGLARL